MLESVIYLSSFLASIWVAFLVFLKNKSSNLNRAFFWFCISASAWILSLYFFYFYNKGYVLFLGRINFVFVELVAYFAFLFGFWFPKKVFEIKTPTKILLNVWLVFLVCITLFTDLIDKNEIITDNGIKTVFGDLYIVFVLHFLLFFSLLIILPLLKYKKLEIVQRHQVNYLFIGAVLTLFFSSTTNIFLPLLFNYYDAQYIGPLGVFFIIGCLTYAIVKHRLMDIKLVMRQSLVFVISLLVVIAPALFIIYLYQKLTPGYALWVDFLVLFITIYFFPIVRNFFFRIANKYFFSSLYDSADVIAGLSDKLRSSLNPGRIYDFIFDSLNEALHFRSFAVLNYDEKNDNYFVKYNRGFDTAGMNTFESNKTLHDKFVSQNKPIIFEEIKMEEVNKEIKKTTNILQKIGVAVLIPMNIKDKTVGLLALGAKESNDIYNDEDFKMLEVVSTQAAIAIENAMLYEEAKQFNIKLEEEVQRATKELRVANEKLKKLDESKSEFISIASHQLRTPLTVIKGYVSMILENSFGKISAVQRDSLDKVYQSNERLISLVENLLNLSRIESGRLQFKYETMNLETIVDSVVDELSTKAKEKKLKLDYKKPAKPLPQITIDQEKIRQVIMNIIDNAIKYTSKGSVTVVVSKEDDNIKFCVSDTGMGVDPNDIPHLFQKFQRGTGTFLVHTEGTGLGLYVAREMIEQHKGKIWVESEGKNRGSKFIFTIPINSATVS